MDIIHVTVKFQCQFSGAYSTKSSTVSMLTFEKMKKGIGSCFSHFDKVQQVRQDLKVISVEQSK